MAVIRPNGSVPLGLLGESCGLQTRSCGASDDALPMCPRLVLQVS